MSSDAYQRWLEDQAVFMRPPRGLDDSTSGLVVHTTPSPPPFRLEREVVWLACSAIVGLGLAVVTALVLLDRESPATASNAAVSEAPPRASLVATIRSAASGPLRHAVHPKQKPTPVAAPAIEREVEPVAVALSSPPAARAPEPAVEPEPEEKEKVTPPDPAPEEPPPPPEPPAPPFDKSAAVAAMKTAASRAAGCGAKKGPFGPGSVSVTVAPSGNVTGVSVSAPYAGTVTGQCVARQFGSVSIPAFSGAALTLTKSFNIKAPDTGETPAPSVSQPSKDQPKAPPTQRTKGNKRN